MNNRIYCEEKSENLNLTLSVRVFENNELNTLEKIIEIQNEAKSYIPNQKDKSIYAYPKDTLHFSLFNFATFPLVGDFETTRNDIEKQNWYKEFMKYVSEEVLPNLNLKDEFKITRFYLDKNEIIKKSLTLNLSPESSTILDFLKNINQNEIKKRLLEIGFPKEPLEKMGTRNFFAINILRFFGQENSYIDNCENLYKFIGKKNKEFEINSISLKLENPVVVISDNYLSNLNPRVLPKSLKNHTSL